MTRLTKKNLLKHLNRADKQDIINEVLTLFEKFRNVKEFYKAELSEDKNPLLEEYKRKISKAYEAGNPKERRTNLNVNRLLKEFKKVSIYEYDTIDLMLHRVECGIAAIKRNNKRSPIFYNCIISTFAEAVKIIDSQVIMNENEDRLEKLVRESEVGKYGMKKSMEAILKK